MCTPISNIYSALAAAKSRSPRRLVAEKILMNRATIRLLIENVSLLDGGCDKTSPPLGMHGPCVIESDLLEDRKFVMLDKDGNVLCAGTI